MRTSRYPKQHLTYDICQALLGSRAFRKIHPNATLLQKEKEDGQIQYSISLHGNRIAVFKSDGSILVNLCGWNTPTTRKRLNDFVERSFSSKKNVPLYRGKEIPSYGWEQISPRQV